MKRIVPIISLFAIIILTGLGLNMLHEQKPAAEQPPPETQAVAVTPAPDFDKHIEDLLNDFLGEITDTVRAYKKQRRVLEDLIKPVNLRNASYIDENYKIMQRLLPELQAQMDRLMLVFEEADEKIHLLLEDQPEDMRMTTLAEWNTLKSEKASLYVTFFMIEQDVLETYKKLMSFYYTKQDLLTVDIETDQIIFENPADLEQEQKMLGTLSELSKKQAALLRKK